jgi:hypothetical protein
MMTFKMAFQAGDVNGFPDFAHQGAQARMTDPSAGKLIGVFKADQGATVLWKFKIIYL